VSLGTYYAVSFKPNVLEKNKNIKKKQAQIRLFKMTRPLSAGLFIFPLLSFLIYILIDTKFSSQNVKGKDQLQGLGVDGMITSEHALTL
jgi:hypothetical protein